MTRQKPVTSGPKHHHQTICYKMAFAINGPPSRDDGRLALAVKLRVPRSSSSNGSRTWCSVSRAPVDLPRLEAGVGRRNKGSDAFRPSLVQTGCYDRRIDSVFSELQTVPGTDRHVSAEAGRQQETLRAIALPNRPIRPALHGVRGTCPVRGWR